MSTLARNDSVISAAIVLVSVVECRALVMLIAAPFIITIRPPCDLGAENAESAYA